MIIRALLSEPDVLILDEAFSNIDQERLQLLINYLNFQKIIVIIVSHQINMMNCQFDCVIIDSGKIVGEEDYESIYLEIIKETCKQLDIHDDLELSVIFVDDQRIHEINKEYRKIDRSTDVISFALEDSEQYYIEGMPREIGDIFISIDHAKMQAEEYGHSFYREMCFLFTHGLLHLLGFDHMNEEDEKVMFSRQKEILNALNIERK